MSVVANHLMGDAVSQSEVVSEAENIIALFDNNEATTRSVSRSIGEIIVATGNTNQTRSGENSEQDTLAYIVNFSDDMGYAVISADRRTDAILAISPDGNIDPEADIDNLGLSVFFANAEAMYEEQIASAEAEEKALLDEALAKMNKGNDLATRSSGFSVKNGNWEVVNKVNPLVTVRWGQRSPYNDNAPLINGKKAAAGCVATAIAQVMSYHRYPTYYNWNEINKNKYHYEYEYVYDPAHPLIASLFRTIGDNVKMNWGVASGAWVYDASTHFQRMGYENTGSYSGYDFERIINSTMNGIPVIMSGYATKETYTYRRWFLGKKRTGTRYDGGHAWVIDGYLNRKRKVELLNGNTVFYSYYQYEQLVHCNWGWNGIDNGYYNNAAFDTNEGPVTRSGEEYNYQFKLETLYDVKPIN